MWCPKIPPRPSVVAMGTRYQTEQECGGECLGNVIQLFKSLWGRRYKEKLSFHSP
jgi:hypothetical protein